MANDFRIDREHLKPLPVGRSEWADFSQKSYTVDKTLLIYQLLSWCDSDELAEGQAYVW